MFQKVFISLVIFLIISLFIYIESLEKPSKKLNRNDEPIQKEMLKDIQETNKYEKTKNIGVQTENSNFKSSEKNYFDRYSTYKDKLKLQKLKEKSEDRRLKLERFKESKKYFNMKNDSIKSLSRDISKQRVGEKYLIQNNVKYRDSRQHNYLLFQKENNARREMIKKLEKGAKINARDF